MIAKAQPLQHHDGFNDEKEMRYGALEPVRATALKRLERHWRRLGFEPIGDTGYLGLSTTNKLPEPKLLLEKKTRSPKPRGKKKPARKAAKR